MNTDRLEAVGPRGEACIIVRVETDDEAPAKRYRYSLASGDRLRLVEGLGVDVFETFDGKRQFRLRDALASNAPPSE